MKSVKCYINLVVLGVVLMAFGGWVVPSIIEDCTCETTTAYYNKHGKKLDTMKRDSIPIEIMRHTIPNAYCGMDTVFTKESSSLTAKYKVLCSHQ